MMNKIFGLLIAFLLTFSLTAGELPSKKFFKENVKEQIQEQEKNNEIASIIDKKGIFALDEDDPDEPDGPSGSGGGGFVGGQPIGDALYPMLLGGFLYIGFLSRRKIASTFRRRKA